MRLYKTDDDPRELVFYLTLRKVVGILGMLLPVILVVVCFALVPCTSIEDSISDYYATRARDFFVGILFVIAWLVPGLRAPGRHRRRSSLPLRAGSGALSRH